MTYTLSGTPTFTTFGTITNEDHSKDAQLFQQPIPATGSEEAILLDLFGALRTINIKGTFTTGDGGLTVAQFTAQLDSLVSGTQTSRVFHSDADGNGGPSGNGNFNVLIQTVSWSYEGGAPNTVNYTISMYEGTS